MRAFKIAFYAVITVALIALLSVPTVAQTFPPAVQLAITQLTTGVIPFTNLRNAASAYINWGATSGVNGYGIRDNAGTLEAKNSGGAWLPLPTSATLPTAAPFITRTPDSNLSNETALSGFTTGLLINTTGTGIPVIYGGATCVNQFPRALSAIGAATCASVGLTADVTGTLPVANGGTGLTAGTSGGILAFTSSGTLVSTSALTASELMIGGGAGVPPSTIGSTGTSTTVLHGNASGAPSFSAVDVTTDVSGILPSANGGTGSAFFTVSGPASSAKTFTFPNANATVLTSATAVTAAQGGTGQTSYTIGDLLYATGAAALSKLAGVATGNALISGGVSTAPAWGKIGLTTHVSGTLPVGNGGTNLTSYTTGDLIYASSSSSLAKLAAVAAGQVVVSAGTTTAPAYSATPRVTSIYLGAAPPGTPLAGSIAMVGVDFGDLGTPTNGTIVYCPDCMKATPCAGGGMGALAKRLNGAWDCD